MKNFWLTATFFTFLIATSSSVKPKIVEEPKDVTLLQGEDATLRCVVEYLPATDLTPVQWTRGDFALGYDRNLSDWERYAMVGDMSVGEYHLNIRNANVLEDDNQYECQVTEYLLRTRKATVTVHVLPSGPFVEGKENDKATVVDVIFGKENLIVCRAAGGRPPAVLRWYKNGDEVFDNVTSEVTGPKLKLYNTSSTLQIVPSSEDVDATYACVMTTNALPSGQIERTLIKLNILRSPVAHVELPSSIKEGDYVTAVCRAASETPILSYRWYISDTEQTGETSASLSLGFANKTWQDSTVSCEAKNAGGFSEINSTAINVFYPPLFVGGSDVVTAEIGENVSLSCEWESNPESSIYWVREDDNAVASTSATLEIHNVDQSDGGRYICIANAGEIGTNRESLELIVNGPPLLKSDPIQYGVLYEDTVIECRLESHPGIDQVEWSWKGVDADVKLVGNQSLSASGIESNESESIKYQGHFISGKPSAGLRIRSLTTDDFHPFSCSVSNIYGHTSMEINLKEGTSNADDITLIGVAVGGAIGGFLLLLVLVFLACYCVRSKRQHKSTTFNKSLSHLQRNSSNTFGKDKDGVCTSDESTPINQLHSLNGSDGINNPEEPLSSPGKGPASTICGSDETNPTTVMGQDDGYQTEEASSWNRSDYNGKAVMGSLAPTKEVFPDSGCFVNLPPPLDTIEHKKPLLESHYRTVNPNAEYPQRSMSVDPYSSSRIPYDPTAFVQPISVLRSFSALGERMSPSPARYFGDNYSEFGPFSGNSFTPQTIGGYSHNSRSLLPTQLPTEPSPYMDRPVYGRSASIPATAFLGTDRPVKMPTGSSQSSLDNFERGSALSASALTGRVINQENLPGRKTSLSARMSRQSSRSSEFVRPLVARMATHV